MTAVLDGQLDLLALLEPEPEVIDLDALIGFTMDVTDPYELDRISLAWSEAYATKPHQEWRPFPGWRESHTGANGLNGAHPSYMYTAELRCRCWRTRSCADRESNPCQCVGGYYHRAYCAGCDWWTLVCDGENEAAEAYLDHCWTGWRELPVIESKMNPKGGYSYAIPKDYPKEWQVPGAPTKDCRGMTKHGTRHVPGGSPYGGYKTAVIKECEAHRGW